MEGNNNSNEPVILGTLRKEKSSKPIFVFLVFVLIIGTTFGLPYLDKYSKDPNTIIGKVYGMFFEAEDLGEDLTINQHTLNENTTITYNEIILSNIKLEVNKIKLDIVNKNEETLILDTTNYYLEIYNDNNDLVKRIKLTGNVTKEKTPMEYTFSNFKFNNMVYYGNVVTFINYEDVVLETHLGISNLTCSKNNNIYKYKFENLKLNNLNHTFKYNDVVNIDKYLETFKNYTNLNNKLNKLVPVSSNIGEIDNGFEYIASIDLSKINYGNLEEYVDYNYYKLDLDAKKVKYEMEAKGYKCL